MNSPLPESNFVDDTMLYSIFKIQNFELEFSKSVSDVYQFKLQEAKTEFVKICIGIAIALQKNDLEYPCTSCRSTRQFQCKYQIRFLYICRNSDVD